MLRGPKNMFKAILDLRTPMGLAKAFGQKFLTAVPICANTFGWSVRAGGVPKGHTCVGKVVRPRSDT